MGDARMVDEVGELELGNGLPKVKLQEPYYAVEKMSSRWMPWLPLYRAWGQSVYKEEGSPDRRVMSLREGLVNLACKLRCLVVHVWAWLSS